MGPITDSKPVSSFRLGTISIATLLWGLFLSSGLAAQGTPGTRESSPGLVIESLEGAQVLRSSGLQAGDSLHSWKRVGTVETGRIDSVCDLWWVEIEISPLGALELSGLRQGEEHSWQVEPADWRPLVVRPDLPEPVLRLYMTGEEKIEQGDLESGLELWRRATDELRDPLLRHWMQFRRIEVQTRARSWQAALDEYQELLAEATDPKCRARALLGSGQLHRKRQMWEQAETDLEAARALSLGHWGESFALAWAEYGLASAANSRGQIDRAESYLDRILQIIEGRSANSLVAAGAMTLRGLIEAQRGAHEAAMASMSRSLEIYERLAPGSLQVTAVLSNLGIAAWQASDLALAESYLQRGLAIEEEIAPGSGAEASTLANLGILASNRGDLELAGERYRRALAIFAEIAPDSLQYATVLFNLGASAQHRGDYDAAQEYFEGSLEYFSKSSPGSLELAAVLDNLGLVAAGRRRWAEARGFHARALGIRRELAPDGPSTAVSLGNLGDVFAEQGDFEAAGEHYQQSLQIGEKQAPDGLGVASALHGLGRVARANGKLGQASQLYRREATIRARLAPGSGRLARAHNALGRVALEAGHLAEAETHLNRACETLEAQVVKLGGSYEARSSFRAQNRHFYRDAIDLSLTRDQEEKAFHLLERSRARGLLAMLAERDVVFDSKELPPELRQRREELAERTDEALGRLASSAASKPRGTATGQPTASEPDPEAELARLRLERETLIAEIRSRAPRLAALRYPQPVDFHQARGELDPGTVMLSFSVGESRTDLFVLQSDVELEVHAVEIGEAALREQVRELLDLIRKTGFPRFRPAFDQASRRLFELLIAPATSSIERSQRLVIIPDGPLHSLPFAALLGPSAREEDRYLAAWKPLHTVQSATLYGELRRSRPANKSPDSSPRELELVAFGDPRFPGSETQVFVSDTRLRSATRRGLFDWQPLPHSRREVQEIARLFPPGTARTYLGDSAREEEAKQLEKGIRRVHFATHAMIDDRFPMSSGLALSTPGGGGGDRDNGLLQAWEILEEVRLEADLVVLSACNSGLGAELDGEGLQGLSRAFQYAGARSVAASLWSVDDRSTSELMVRFYRHLRAGKTKDEALRQAQLELLQGPISMQESSGQKVMKDYSAPFHWAAFQILGDWR